MPAPDGPHIKTVYKPDGTMIKAPTGYGGQLCHEAVKPYARRHGGLGELTPTDEALERPYLETERSEEQRERA